MAEPIHTGIQVDVEPPDNIFTRIAKGTWGIVKKLGTEFIDHAPEIAAMVATSYMHTRAQRGSKFGVDLNQYDFDATIGEALRSTNPYASRQPNIVLPHPQAPQMHIARNVLDNNRPGMEAQLKRGRHSPRQFGKLLRGRHNPLLGKKRQAPPVSEDLNNTVANPAAITYQQSLPVNNAPVHENPYFAVQNLQYAQQPKSYWQVKKEHDERMAAMQAEIDRITERNEKIKAWKRDQQWLRDRLRQIREAEDRKLLARQQQQADAQQVKSTETKQSALIRVGKLHGDWRDTIEKPLDSFTAEVWTGSNPSKTSQFDANTATEVANAIRKAGYVERLILTGHGDPSGIGQTPDNTGAVINKYDILAAFDPYITGEVKAPKEIFIFACYTAAENQSIAWLISGKLRNTLVIAPKSRLLAPWNIPIGARLKHFVVFKNGKIVLET